MGVELKPLGVVCNIQCHYCYEHPLRDVSNKMPAYDIEVMKAAVLREGRPFSLFGGEPLLLPKVDLKALWSWGLEQFGENGVQTNGALIDDDHIAMFKAYKVNVGISIDGPAELNDARWGGSLAKTREATSRSQSAIEALCREGIPPGLIVTLHRGNATAEKLPLLCDWFLELDRIGIRNARLHLLEVDTPKIRDLYSLTQESCIEALVCLRSLERDRLQNLRFDLFTDMRALLMGRDEKSTCIWNACDPFSTQAVRGIEGDGQATNCSRTTKEGINFVRSDEARYERYLALYRTSQEHGGCKDCRFFLMCKGQCPGTAIDGDWRNRSENCGAWKGLFEYLERELVDAGETPLSLKSERKDIEDLFIRRWERGQNTQIARAMKDVARLRQSTPLATRKSSQPIAVHEFKRLSWASDTAREVWAPRLSRIQAAWIDIDCVSIAAEVRKCAVISLTPEQLVRRARILSNIDLSTLPLSIHGEGVRSGRGEALNTLRVAIGSPENVAALGKAFNHGDAATLSRLLGIPACCNAHLRNAVTRHVFGDPTWSASIHSQTADSERTLDGPWQTNILWRWLGVCALPHIPCCPSCASSLTFADALVDVGRQAGYEDEMNWMVEVLSWPVEWTALHGIAIVKTPILKISAATDATDMKLTVRRRGQGYPSEGAKGLSFPYERQGTARFTNSKAFQAGVEHARSL